MNCEKAENYLSAYLDDMLDPQLREEVAAHLESCALCSEVVAEYRRFDILLRDIPRVSPPPELRNRIFESPQYAAILRREARVGDAPASVPLPRPHQSPTRGSPPRWTRVALQSAAVLAIIVGSALLLKQGFFHSSPTTTGHTSTPIIGNINPESAPLAAGNRVIYEHNGALWSAPENGPGIGEQLTPTTIQVGSIWSVSPDGRLVAYVEAATGRIHVIRADRQNDVAFASFSALCSSSTCLAHIALVWSPDGKYLAYLSTNGALHVVNVDGTHDLTVVTSEQGIATMLVWSSDSLRLAFVQVNGTVESICDYSLTGSSVAQVAASVDPANSDASVAELLWLTNKKQPTLTWTSWQASTKSLTGIFSCDVLGRPSVQRLTPSNVKLTAAGFNPLESGGTWLISTTDQTGAPEIASVGGSKPGLVITNAAPGNTITGTISGVYWSPLGDTVAIVTTTGQMVLSTNNGASLSQPVFTSNVSGAPVWSSDGTHLATPLTLGIVSLNITAGTPTQVYRLLPSVPTLTTMTMLWSPDGQVIAITSPSGTYLTSSDQKNVYGSNNYKQVDTQTTVGPFAWSYSG
jgi:hypothetical protein